MIVQINAPADAVGHFCRICSSFQVLGCQQTGRNSQALELLLSKHISSFQEQMSFMFSLMS